MNSHVAVLCPEFSARSERLKSIPRQYSYLLSLFFALHDQTNNERVSECRENMGVCMRFHVFLGLFSEDILTSWNVFPYLRVGVKGLVADFESCWIHLWYLHITFSCRPTRSLPQSWKFENLSKNSCFFSNPFFTEMLKISLLVTHPGQATEWMTKRCCFLKKASQHQRKAKPKILKASSSTGGLRRRGEGRVVRQSEESLEMLRKAKIVGWIRVH